MSKPAIEGWFTEGDGTALVGSLCSECGSYFFPKALDFCRNPACSSTCSSTELKEVELSRRGKIWSYTNACYQPPPPFVAEEPFEPFAIVAVELMREKLVVLGQCIKGIGVEDLRIGAEVELTSEVLFGDEAGEQIIFKWKPVG